MNSIHKIYWGNNMNDLVIFVEGLDDERFFKKIVTPLFENRYKHVNVIQYARLKKKTLKGHINVINKVGNDYLYVKDIDFTNSICEAKKKEIEKFSFLDEKKIIIVVKEIESWYMAGLSNENSSKLGIKYLPNTDTLIKERFNSLLPCDSLSRISLMIDILKEFNRELARYKNNSYKYFEECFI